MSRPALLARTLAGVALAALAAGAVRAQTTTPTAAPLRSPFDGVVVFGDSLSDNGDIALASGSPVVARYTTNPGKVTVEDVASAYGFTLAPSLAGGTDFAFGGAGVLTNAPGVPATVPTETAQITGYLAAHSTLDPHTLYSVFGGANDIFYAATAVGAAAQAQAAIAKATAGLPPAFAAAVAAQINAAVLKGAGVSSFLTADQAGQAIIAAGVQEGALIGRMQAAGAKYILVFNLPDIGLTPQARAQDAAAPGAAASLTQLSVAYNTALNGALSTSGAGIVPVDTFDLLRQVVASPARYGFVNVTTPACTVASSINCTPATLAAPNAASTYLFADGVHPTNATHALFADVVLSELQAPSYISLLAEAPLQVSTVQRSGWVNELALDSTAPAGEPSGTGVRLFGGVGYQDQSFDARGFTASGAGNDGGVATLGVDWRVGADASLGGVLTGGQAYADFDDGAAKFRTQTVMFSVFGQYRFLQHGYVQGAAGFGSLSYDDIRRQFAVGPAIETEHGSTGGTSTTATLGAGWWFGAEPLQVGPYVQAQYDRVRVNRYVEDGQDATAMTFGAQAREALVGEAGLRAQGTWRTGFATLSPFLQAGYDYDGRANVRYVDAGLVNMAGTFAMPGYEPSQSWGSVQAGLDARFAGGWGAYAAYQGRFADNSQSFSSFNVGLKYSF